MNIDGKDKRGGATSGMNIKSLMNIDGKDKKNEDRNRRFNTETFSC